MTLRTLFELSRRIFSKRERHSANGEIAESVLSRSEYQAATTVCLYMSTWREVDTKPLFADILTRGVTVVFPRVENRTLLLRRVRSIRDFTRGSYGILEPKKSCSVVPPDRVDVFIVPGVAFDRFGFRLGWGKGYYDKLLAGTRGFKMGLAYSIQLIAQVPHTSYDVPMDMVVTETEVVVCHR